MPAPVRVRVLPAKVAGPLTMLKTIGSPLLALALRVKGASPKVLSAKVAKAMDWPTWMTVSAM